MSYYYSGYRIEIQLTDGVWTDVTSDVMDAITGNMGIGGVTPLDRVAFTGQMQFILRNDAGCSGGLANYYTPGHPNCRATFQTGCKVRLVIDYGGRTYTRFYGRIPSTGINIEAGMYSNRVSVSVNDFIEQTAAHDLELPAYTTNKRIDEIVPLIMANMPYAPLSAEYNVGSSTFASVFDTTRAQTKALDEMSKLAISELGYIYIKQSVDYDEVLTVEGRGTRSSTAIGTVPVFSGVLENILLESGGEMLLENNAETGNVLVAGAGYAAVNGTYVYSGLSDGKAYYAKDAAYIAWSSGRSRWDIVVSTLQIYQSTDDVATPDLVTTWTLGMYGLNPIPTVTLYYSTSNSLVLENSTNSEACFENSASHVAISHARDYYNNIQVRSYPRKVDAAATTVLFTLNKELRIGAGETVTITGRFRDPANEAVSVAGIDMVTPAVTTDYTMFTGAGGTGSNISADLTVTATYGANGVEYELVNGNASTGYINKLQARGKGVYTYNPIEKNFKYEAGITADGTRKLMLNMPYQDDPLEADDFGSVLIDQYNRKITVAESVRFFANRSLFLLGAFVHLQVGDKIHLESTPTGINDTFFIHNISFTIIPGGAVEFVYGIKPSYYDTFSYWELDSLTLSQLDTTTNLGF